MRCGICKANGVCEEIEGNCEQANEIANRLYQQGREDKYQEITSEFMLLTEKQVEEIRADAINAIKNDLHKRLTEEMNNPYQDQGLCQGLYFGIQRCDWYLDDSKEHK